MGFYSPFDNSTLTFAVYGSFSVDPFTKNRVQNSVDEVYTCNIQLNVAQSDVREGVNLGDLVCTGKLLAPSVFSEKVKVGALAQAVINGVQGTVRLVDIGTNVLPIARASQFQNFVGVFEQVGRTG